MMESVEKTTQDSKFVLQTVFSNLFPLYQNVPCGGENVEKDDVVKSIFLQLFPSSKFITIELGKFMQGSC